MKLSTVECQVAAPISLEKQIKFLRTLPNKFSINGLYRQGSYVPLKGDYFIDIDGKGTLKPINYAEPLPNGDYNIVDSDGHIVESVRKNKIRKFETTPTVDSGIYTLLAYLLDIAAYNSNPYKKLYLEDPLNISKACLLNIPIGLITGGFQCDKFDDVWHIEEMDMFIKHFFHIEKMGGKTLSILSKVLEEIRIIFENIMYANNTLIYDFDIIAPNSIIIKGLIDIRAYRYIMACEVKEIMDEISKESHSE